MNGPMSPSLVETMGTPGSPCRPHPLTDIPGLLRMPVLKGCIVTLDVMGRWKAIARRIREQGADCVLRVRADHKGLHARLEDTFALERAGNFAEYAHEDADTVGKGHGRIEIRRCWTTGNPDREWRDLASLVRVESERRCGDRGGAQALDHRERPPLGPGRGLRRGGQPHPHRPCRPQHGHPGASPASGWRPPGTRTTCAD